MTLARSAQPQRIDRPITDGERSPLLALLFAVYLVLLVWTVLWKLHEPFIGGDWMRAIKLVPFVSSAGFGASAPFEVGMNVLIFAPFGGYLRLLAPSWSVSRIAVVTAFVSLAMEVTQYALALGSTDITDVIANTAGGVAGVALVALVRRVFTGRASVVVTRFCVVSTAVSLVAVGAHIASFPELPAPGQGVVVTGAEAD